MADAPAQRNVDELFDLLRIRAAEVAGLSAPDRERALASIHAQHEQSGLKAGMSRATAIDMADRLDSWIRAALKLIEQEGLSTTLH